MTNSREHAQDTVEYGLLAALVVIVVLLGANAMGTAIHEWLARLVAVVTSYGR